MTVEDPDERLKDCLATAQHLTEENQHLRDAAASFAELAGRLNDALNQERRVAPHDRRAHPRDTPERRRPKSD